MKFSVVSPVYGAASLLEELVREIEATVRGLTDDYEIILVDDNSPDASADIIEKICEHNKKVKAIFLSRNFGQQYALNAGLDASSGDWIVTLDCDLQDTPALILDLYDKAQEGYDIVFASRKNRKDGFIKKAGSKLFNLLLGFLTDTAQDDSIANFVLYRKAVVDAMKQLGDYRRYYPLMNHWIGFKSIKLEVPHAERTDGNKSSYTLRKRIRLALNTSVAFSTKPLRLIVYIGIILMSLSMLVGLALIVNYLFSRVTVSGWLTLFVSLWFIAGLMMLILGILAVYIGEIFLQTKHRPTYVENKRLNF